jgi:Pvc16 N-terminal domain
MISDAMRLLQATLQDYISDLEPTLGANPVVVVDNIAMAEQLGGTNTQLNGHVVMSLVNLQEETTLKNAPYYRVENNRTVYKNPPVSLNLFILFSVLHSQYDTALRLLSRVIECFQSQTDISFTTHPAPGNISHDVQIVPDLYSLTFEQLNHLWGSLGGKQVPFVLYRARLVAIEAERRQAEGPIITEVNAN